jgi:hypothetical protein
VSFVFVFQTIKQLCGVLDARWNKEQARRSDAASAIMNGLILAVLGLSASIFASCSLCLKVVRPRGLKGEH